MSETGMTSESMAHQVVLHHETDASCNFQGTQPREGQTPLVYEGGGVVLRSVTMRQIVADWARLGFVSSSHHAGYLTFVEGPHLARKHGTTGHLARYDFLPLVRRVNGELVDCREGIPVLARRIE